jgi:hypothetical protein
VGERLHFQTFIFLKHSTDGYTWVSFKFKNVTRLMHLTFQKLLFVFASLGNGVNVGAPTVSVIPDGQ